MEIGIFPGSFDPIHLGHLLVAEHFLNYTSLSGIWFLISPQNPLKNKESLTEVGHRLAMVKLAMEGSPNLIASDLELYLPRPSYTVDTMDFIKKRWPEITFSLIIGSDNVVNFSKWKNYERLAKENPILVYPRKGYLRASIREESSVDRTFSHVEAPLIELSSTLIRSTIREKKSIRFMVPDSVLDYIIVHELYQ